MIRKHKHFSRPRKLYDSDRIAAENKLASQYGLKNKREIWKTEAKVRYYRNRAKKLVTASQEEQKNFFGKLNEIGLTVKSIADVLALTKEDLFKRRLSHVLIKKGLATKPGQARQMIVHRRVTINSCVVNSPGYLVKVEEEKGIIAKQFKISVKKEVVENADVLGAENE